MFMKISLSKPDAAKYIFDEHYRLKKMTPEEEYMLKVYKLHLETIVEHPYGYHIETHNLILQNMSNSLEYGVLFTHLYRNAPYIIDIINYETVNQESIFRGLVSDGFLETYWDCLEDYSREQAAKYAYDETLNKYGVLFTNILNKYPDFVEFLLDEFDNSRNSYNV